MGALRARVQRCSTMGRRMPEATPSTSHMRASPGPAVAVWVRAPAAAAPTQVERAACSLSTATNSVSTSPLATYSLKVSMMMVCGVTG